ncbi:hypothetical protein [Brucella sp. 22210]|uniref:hypothetical protein n=1 Tax=Brucella sp. 22210 TaxID=3453892 RepID=UPI003F87954C
MLKKITMCGTLLVSTAFASCGSAATWKENNDKGLVVYGVGNGSTGQITLVCDPDNLWAMDSNKESSKFYLFTTLHNEQLAGPTITIKANGYNAAFPYEGGAIVADGSWNKLIKALSKPGPVSIAVGTKKFSLTLDKPLASKCAWPAHS